MKLLGSMHISLLLLAIINMVPVMEADGSWGILAFITSAAILSYLYHAYRHRYASDRKIPRWMIYLFVVAAVGFLIYEMFFPHEEPTVYLIDLAHFIALLCCCKFFELYTYRDAGLVALIAFLLLVISAFVSASPIFGLVIVVDATFGVGWIITFYARGEQNGVFMRRRAAHVLRSTRSGGRGASASRRCEWQTASLSTGNYIRNGPLAGSTDVSESTTNKRIGRIRLSIFRPTATCSFALMFLASLIFILVPRDLEAGWLGRIHGLMESSVTGFSDIVELSNNEIQEDDSPVLRARFYQNGRLLTDEQLQPYLRGWTFDRYYGGRWRRTPRLAVRIGSWSPGEPSALLDDADDLSADDMIRQEIWLENTVEGVLFTLYPPLGFESPEMKYIKLDRLDLALQAPSRSRKKAHYIAYSSPAQTPAEDEILRRRPHSPRDGWSSIPPRVLEFAHTFAANIGDPTDPEQHEYIAQSISDYLTSGLFEYTFNRGGFNGTDDPVDNFLFVNRRGHCEYFASAMAVLCQAVGIHARLVSGYQGGEYNTVGGFFQFRQKDAHSWVEVFLFDRGWVPFDPSPPSAAGRRRADTSLLARTRRLWDYMQFKWSTLVVTFDTSDRQDMMINFRKWFASMSQGDQRPKSVVDTIKALLWGPNLLVFWQRLLYWLLLVLCVAFVLLLIRIVWILSIMLRELFPASRGRRGKQRRRPLARFYDRLLLLLARKGHVKPTFATPREFASALAGTHSDLVSLPELTEWYYQVQYGRRSLSVDQQQRIKELLQRLREDPAFAS